MKRISTSTKVADKFGPGKHGFTDGNASTGIEPTDLEAALFDHVQEELCSVIEAAGIDVDGSSVNMLLQALRSAGVFQTPAQFDNSTRGVTSAFVQRALGSLSGVRSLNSTTTLTAADAGREIALFGASGFTVTLPLGSTLVAGTSIHFSSTMTAGNVALVRQGSDVISVGTNTVTGITLFGGSRLTVTWNGTAWAASGESQLPHSPLFAASLAANGHRRLPSGDIEQWGQISVSVGSTTPSSNTVSFPIQFPNFCRGVTGSFAAGIGEGYLSHTCEGVGTSSFTLRAQKGAGSTTAITFLWRAIGY